MVKKDNFLEIVSSTNPFIIGVQIPLESDTPAVTAFKEGEIVSVKVTKSKKQYKNFCNYVIAPIKVKNMVYGVINITEKKDDKEFTLKEIKIIERFVDSISILIENLFLTENIKKEKYKLEKTLKELNETQKMKEELSNMIIHDLKSPLSQIISNIDILLMDNNIKDAYFDVLDAAMKGCEDMMMMIQNLVDIYKFEQNKFDITKTLENINELLKETAHKLYSLIVEKKQNVYFELDNDLPLTNVDRMLFTRIFYNLLHNAIKYSPVEADIFIKTRQKEDFIIIEIKNTGVGIPKKDLKKIFEKFYSIYRNNESSGLGLTFVKLAVEAHNGKIEVSSKENEWNKFRITLPVEKMKEINSEVLDLTL